jgi:hypothetical protein
VLVDTTPDFRMQALRAHIDRIDAILYTHSHADHVLGLDDVRPFNYKQRSAIPIYGTDETLSAIQRVFCYAFDAGPQESAVPRLNLHTLDGAPFDLFGLEFMPIRLLHGKSVVLGFRFGPAAYLTDHSDIPDESKEKAAGAGRFVFGCAADIARTRRIRRSNVRSRGWRSCGRGARSSRTSVTIFRTRRPKRPFRSTCGWPTTGLEIHVTPAVEPAGLNANRARIATGGGLHSVCRFDRQLSMASIAGIDFCFTR